jgi:hypothetical protein
MNVALLLHECRRRGIELRAEGDAIGFRAPKGAMTVDLAETIAAHREGLRDALAGEATEARGVTGSGPGPHGAGLVPGFGPHGPACGPGMWTKDAVATPCQDAVGEAEEEETPLLVHMVHINPR